MSNCPAPRRGQDTGYRGRQRGRTCRRDTITRGDRLHRDRNAGRCFVARIRAIARARGSSAGSSRASRAHRWTVTQHGITREHSRGRSPGRRHRA